MATNDDLISRIKQSRIGKAVSNVLSDSAKGYQIAGRAINNSPQRQQFSRGVQGFSNFVNKLEASPVGAPSRFVQGFGTNIARSAIRSGDILGQRQDLINKRLEGKSFRERLSSLPTAEENRLLISGGFQGGKTLAQINPIGGSKALAGGLFASGLQGTFGGFQGKDIATEAGKGFGEGLGLRQVTRFTDPVISKAVGAVGGGLLAKQVGQRAVSGVGNVIEDEILSKLEGFKVKNVDRLMSLAIGAVVAGNDDLLKGLKKSITSSGATPKQADEVVKKVEQLRNRKGQYTKIGKVEQPLIGVDGKPFEPQKTVLQERPDGTGMSLIPKAKSRLKELMKDQPGFIDLSAKVGTESKPTKGVEPLIEEARKYKSAEEFVKNTPEYISWKSRNPVVEFGVNDLRKNVLGENRIQAKIDELRNNNIPVTKDGIVTLYRGADYKTGDIVHPQAWWTTNKEIAQKYGGELSEIKVNVSDVKSYGKNLTSGFGITYQNPVALIKNKNGIFVAPDKIKLTDIYNQAKGETIVNPLTGETIPKPTGRQAGFIDLSAKVGTESKPTKGLEPLIEEARKYKSAEEFIKAQGQPLYHGTDANFNEFSLKNFGKTDEGFLGKGVYLSGSKTNAKQYGSNLVEATADLKNPYIYNDSYFFGAFSPSKIKRDIGLPDSASATDIRNALIARGHDGVVVNELKDSGKIIKNAEVVVFDPKNIKTKSQLTDIYNQAKGETIVNPLTGETIPKPTGRQAGFIDFGADVGVKAPQIYDELFNSKTPQEAEFNINNILDDIRFRGDKTDFQALKRALKDFKSQIVTGRGLPRNPEYDRLFNLIETIESQTIKDFQLKPQQSIEPSFQEKQKEVRLKPETQKIINDARSEIGIDKEEKGRGIKQIANDLYTQWVNRYAPVERASQFVKKKLKTQNASLRPENDPEYLVRRFTGAGGIASERFNNVLKPIIDELDARKIDKVDMDAYLKAKRDIGLGERNILGSDTNLASKRVVALMEKYPGIDEVANKLYKYQNDGFQEMIDAGFLSKESADVIRQQNPDYVPFQRVMDDLDNYLGIPSNKLQQGTSPIQKIKGSKRQIVSPIESVIANTFKQRAAIEKNRVAKSIVDLQKVAPELGFEQMKKSTPETITIWNDGKKEYWKVGSEIADTVKAVNEESTNALLKIFQAPASLLRQGATGRNPDFLIPNVVKDQFDAGISSKYGYIPFIDYVSGLKSMIGNDEIYQKWANSGAKIDLGEISGRKSISKSFDQAAKRKGLMGWIGTGLDKLGTISEVPTRVGLFKKAYKKTGNELIAAMESRDATVDFARMGSKMKTANSIIPFLNVGVQGFDKIMRQAKNNPGKLAINAGIYAALPAITTTLYNLLNHGEEYSEIPQYVKDSNFVFVSGRNNDGTVDYFTIPKGNIAPLITNPIENFLTYLYGQNESTLAEFATQFISSALPVLGDGSSVKEVATKTIGQNLPQLIKPPIEGLLNRSFYKYDPEKEQSKEIVSSYLKNKEPYQQDYEWTPKTYKKIGAALNVSPLSVQHYLESYLAGYTKVPTQVIGILDDISSGNEIRKNDIPILRRFMSTTFPSSTKKTTKTEEKRTGFMERVTGKVSASEKTPPAVVTKEAIDDIKKRVKEGERVSNTELDIAYLGKIENLPSSNRYDKSIRDSKLYAKFGTIEEDENLTETQKQYLYEKIATELNTASAPTKIGSLEVSTRETDNFPFPDFNSSAPGQTLRADLNFSGVGDADIVLHFKTPNGKVISVPQTRESFNGNKQEYGLEMNIPKDSGYGTGEIWATVNGKEVSGTRKKHQILNTQAVNRYASGSTPEEFQANQQQIDKLRSTNPTFSRDINRNITVEDLKTYQVAKDEVPRKTLYVYDQMDSMQSKDELMAFLAQGRRPINGQILISDGVIDNLVSDGVIPYELGKELKKYDLNEDGTQKTTKKTSSKSGSSKKGTTKNDQEIAKIKAYGKYLDAIKNITPASGYPQGKIPTTKINVQGLTFGS